MPKKSSKSTGRTCPNIETFTTFLARNAGGERGTHGPLTSLPGASPARTLATRVSVSASAANGLAYGPSLLGSFASFDPAMCLWRMCQRSLFEDLEECLETFPNSGLMRSGTLYRLGRLVPRIDVGGCFCWPTPTAHCAKGQKTPYKQGGCGLAAAMADLYPTPRSAERGAYQRDRGQKGKERLTLTGLAIEGLLPTPLEADGSKGHRRGNGKPKRNLSTEVKKLFATPRGSAANYGRPRPNDRGDLQAQVLAMYPTPRADGRDNAGGSNSRRTAKAQGTYFGRTLNPQFVEWLMGFPIGWTGLEA
jgi:hypothetical protein